MNKNISRELTFLLAFVLFLSVSSLSFSQVRVSHNSKSDFWNKVQFGGGLGLNFGSNYTNLTLAPSAIYNANQYVSLGLGVQYSYVKQKNYYDSHIYGGSLLSLFHPIPRIQLSAELEQLRVNNSYEKNWGGHSDDFWNTALFLGAGYRTNNVTIGARYNVLYKDKDNVYGEALMPFVRVYF